MIFPFGNVASQQNSTAGIGLVAMAPPVGVVDLASPVATVNLAPPVSMVNLAPPVGVVDLAPTSWCGGPGPHQLVW